MNTVNLTYYGGVAIIVGGIDYFLDRAPKRALIVAGIAVITVYILNHIGAKPIQT